MIVIFVYLMLLETKSWSSPIPVQEKISAEKWYDVFEGCEPVGTTSQAILQFKERITNENLTDCLIFESSTKDGLGLHLSCTDGIGMVATPKANCKRLNAPFIKNGFNQ